MAYCSWIVKAVNACPYHWFAIGFDCGGEAIGKSRLACAVNAVDRDNPAALHLCDMLGDSGKGLHVECAPVP
jgi:hypothetical protein